MILELADVISSRSKFKLLKLLIQYSTPIPLRTIASLTDIPIRSVVLALEGLLKQKIVHDSRVNQSRLFQMNSAHPFYEELRNIFTQVERSEIKIRSRTNQDGAAQAFKFAQSANQFFSTSE